jgi:hypothetical protein
LPGQKARSVTRVYFTGAAVLLPGCSFASAYVSHVLLAATAQASPKPKAKEPLLQRFIPLKSKIFFQFILCGLFVSIIFDKLCQSKFIQRWTV